MSRTTFTAVRRLGQVGYVARGAVFALIGVLVVKAAMDHQPGKAQGFDVALKSLAGAPVGQVLLVLPALGLICFGAYCCGRGALPPALSAALAVGLRSNATAAGGRDVERVDAGRHRDPDPQVGGARARAATARALGAEHSAARSVASGGSSASRQPRPGPGSGRAR